MDIIKLCLFINWLYICLDLINKGIMNKKKKGMILIIASLVIMSLTIFVMRDDRDMAEIEKAQEVDIEQTAAETLNEDNDLFNDDVDFGDIEIAPLALDTTKTEKF